MAESYLGEKWLEITGKDVDIPCLCELQFEKHISVDLELGKLDGVHRDGLLPAVLEVPTGTLVLDVLRRRQAVEDRSYLHREPGALNQLVHLGEEARGVVPIQLVLSIVTSKV